MAEVKVGIQLVKKSFERPSTSNSKPLNGAPGYTLFLFKAVRSSNGPVSLKFSYARKNDKQKVLETIKENAKNNDQKNKYKKLVTLFVIFIENKEIRLIK